MSARHLGRAAWAASLLLFLLHCPVQAQDATGRIAGHVTDPSGAAIPNARITVTNLATNIPRETTTDTEGYYQVQFLPIGNYEVSAEAGGFSRAVTRPDTSLEINQTLRVDIELQVGSTSNTITVESQATIVETQNATVGGTVTGQAIFELPLNGRNTLDLLGTMPGVTPTNLDNTSAGTYSIGGGRTDSVTYLLDGGNNNNLLNNGVVLNPNPDAVAEFRVLQSNYSAEYGRNAGGVVSVVTKSGENELHGTAYDYIRNEALTANTFFNNQQDIPRQILKRHQFGATLGGPVVIPKVVDGRNKAFFFFAYQGQRETSVVQQGKVNVFTPEQAAGDFSHAVDGGPDPTVASFLQANPYWQPDPALAAQAIIDPSKVDPVAKAYFDAGLIPTSPAGFLFPQDTAKNDVDEYMGKMDLNLSSRDQLSILLSSRSNPRVIPFNQATVVGYPTSTDIANYYGSTNYTHTFSPSLINVFRFTAQRNNTLQQAPIGTKPGPNELGIETTPDIATGPPVLDFYGSGLAIGYSPQGPTSLINNTYSFYDDISWTKGRHSLKAGFYFSPYQNNTLYDYYVNGEFGFYGPGTGVGTTNDFADFVLGLPDEYFQFPVAPSNIRTNSYAGYFQDAWKIHPRLTLTLGIRYEYNQPKYDTQGRSFSLVPGAQSTRFPNAPTGLVFPGDPQAPRGSNFSDKNDWAPRFGFAWDVFGNAKTSVRGGFGMFYDILKGEDNLQFNGQAPFFASTDLFPGPDIGYDPESGVPLYSVTPGAFTNPFTATGAVNPFPSRPPDPNINFADAGFLPFGGGSVYFVDPHLRTPYVFQYNLSVQQQLAANTAVEIGYIGSAGHKLTSLQDVNPFPLGTNDRVLGTDNFRYLYQFNNISNSNYNALQLNVTKRVGGDNRWFHNSFVVFAYTWSHSIDNSSGFRNRNSVVPFYDHRVFRASSDTDIRQYMSLSGGLDLPFDQMWQSGPKLLTKGWTLYPIMTYRTGFTLDVFGGFTTSTDNPGPSGAGDAGAVHADLTGSTVPTYDARRQQTIVDNNFGASSTGNYYFDPNALSNSRLIDLNAIARDDASQLAGQFTYGTFPRNGLRGPGRFNFDLALAKHFLLFGEKLDVELRADAFNLLNNVQFKEPDVTIGSGTFGQISTTYDPRIVQVALHLRF